MKPTALRTSGARNRWDTSSRYADAEEGKARWDAFVCVTKEMVRILFLESLHVSKTPPGPSIRQNQVAIALWKLSQFLARTVPEESDETIGNDAVIFARHLLGIRAALPKGGYGLEPLPQWLQGESKISTEESVTQLVLK